MLQPSSAASALRLLAPLAGFGLWACAQMPGMRSDTGAREAGHAGRVEASAPLAPASKDWAPPTALDRMLDAKPHALPAVKPAALTSLSASPPSTAKGAAPEAAGAAFRIQVDALSDVDAAQARKAVLEGKLGMRVDMIFDAPYFKLRVGNFATRQEAEDKLLDLAGKNVQGFIVRQ